MRRIVPVLLVVLSCVSFAYAEDLAIAENAGESIETVTELDLSEVDQPAAGEEIASEPLEVIQNEIVFPDPPYAVYLVEEPYLEDEEAALLALVGDSGYPGTISTAVYQYFRDLSGSLPVGVHYVFYRADRYIYRLVYGEDLTLSGNDFSGGAINVIDYDTENSYNTLDRYTDTSFRFSDPGYMVYTDLGGGYPPLFQGVTTRDFEALRFVVVVGLLGAFVVRLFKY